MKYPTIDQGVLRMALLGFQMRRSEIDAAIADIQAHLGGVRPGQPLTTDTGVLEANSTSKKRLSAATRKRMAEAQKKRWQLLKAKKAPAKTARSTATVKGKAVFMRPARKQRPVQVKAAERVSQKGLKAALKPKAAVKKAPKPKAVKVTLQPPQITEATPVQAAAEQLPEAATE